LPSGICKWASVWGSSRWIQCVPWHSWNVECCER
jgi:hypothetical protein